MRCASHTTVRRDTEAGYSPARPVRRGFIKLRRYLKIITGGNHHQPAAIRQDWFLSFLYCHGFARCQAFQPGSYRIRLFYKSIQAVELHLPAEYPFNCFHKRSDNRCFLFVALNCIFLSDSYRINSCE
jgi:hypothetical protein